MNVLCLGHPVSGRVGVGKCGREWENEGEKPWVGGAENRIGQKKLKLQQPHNAQ